MFALGIHGKPALDDAFALIENFANRPKTRKTNDGRKCTPKEAADDEWHQTADDAHKEENPPGTRAEIIFSLNDKGMEDADDEKGAKTKNNALPVDVDAENRNSVHKKIRV